MIFFCQKMTKRKGSKCRESFQMQLQGSIFQNCFLGGGQFKKSLKKWGFIQEKTQKLDFSDYLGLYSRVGQH